MFGSEIRKIFFSYALLSCLSGGRSHIVVHRHVYSRGIFLKKANHYDNFDCYTLGNAKPVVGTSENVAEPDYDVTKMAAILIFNTNLRCFIISIIVGRFQFFRYQNVQNDKCCNSHQRKMAELNDGVTKMADILNLNENLLCIMLLLILGHFEN